VGTLLDSEADRFRAVLGQQGVERDAPGSLGRAADAVRAARASTTVLGPGSTG
jgi:hypothetical protein